jgi:hypothetical protein
LEVRIDPISEKRWGFLLEIKEEAYFNQAEKECRYGEGCKAHFRVGDRNSNGKIILSGGKVSL